MDCYCSVPVVSVTPASEKVPPSPVPPHNVRAADDTTPVSRTTTDKRLPAGSVAGGMFIV